MKSRVLRLMWLVVIASSAVARAGLIYDNGGPVQNSINMTGTRVADDFSLSASASVAAVRFWASEIGFPAGFSGTVTWAIYNDNSGSIGTLVPSATGTVSGLAGVAEPLGPSVLTYRIDFDFNSPLTLAAGQYWLELHEGSSLTTNDGSGIFWQWSNCCSGNAKGDLLPRSSPPASGVDGEYAFQLFDAPTSVPEPSTFVLLIGPTAAMILFRRRVRSTKG